MATTGRARNSFRKEKIPAELFEIAAEEKDYLFVQNSQILNAGRGLFSVIPIFKNEIIAIFKGRVLSAVQAETHAASGSGTYFINLPDGKTLDCKNTKCFAKYANDASGSGNTNFKNNAFITLTSNDKVCLAAIKKINPGEEIFCDYGKNYWRHNTLQKRK
ncbi:MAG: SET domain-containing protein-lysine N-methyltransferase [Chitinophagales bacterium]